MRVDQIFEALQFTFDENTKLSVKKLSIALGGRGRAKAELEKAIGCQLHDTRDHFEWQRGQAKVTYILNSDNELWYDECGEIIDPTACFIPMPCSVLLDAKRVKCLCGQAIMSADGHPFFRPTPADIATDLLVVAEWGGANSQTRGLSVEKMQKLPTEFYTWAEKVTSKRGGVGMDYYIMPLQADKRAAIVEAYKTMERELRVNPALTFLLKLELLEEIEATIPDINEKIAEINTKFLDLKKTVLMLDVTECYVERPEVEIEVKKAGANPSVGQSVEELRGTLKQLMDIPKQAEGNLMETSCIVKAWERFAPRYALLSGLVKSLFGFLTIDSQGATVYLPSEDGGLLEDYRYGFTECAFGNCVDFLNNILAEENEAKEHNDYFLRYGL